MFDLDLKLEKLLHEERASLGNAKLTRYADDIVFSTDMRGACGYFVGALRRLLSETKSPRLRINPEKTKMMSRAGGSMLVTGLRIRQDTQITLHRAYKDKVRLMLSLLRKRKLDNKDFPVLRGHLSYIRMIDGRFLTKLMFKYSAEIERLQ
jgi:hypothetical protein